MSIRIPAIIPQRPQPATPLAENPAPLLEASLRHIWETAMHDLPFVNPAVQVEALGFRRVDGDWLGMTVTPWAINLVLVPGGGALWQDIPTGEHRQIAFPAGPIEFIGDNNPDRSAPIQAYQYCPMITKMQQVADHASARAAAEAVMLAIFEPPPAVEAEASAEPPAAPEPAAEVRPARRAFLRGIVAGKA